MDDDVDYEGLCIFKVIFEENDVLLLIRRIVRREDVIVECFDEIFEVDL